MEVRRYRLKMEVRTGLDVNAATLRRAISNALLSVEGGSEAVHSDRDDDSHWFTIHDPVWFRLTEDDETGDDVEHLMLDSDFGRIR